MNCESVGQRGVTIQSSLRDSGIIDLESQPSDESLGYYQSSVRDEEPTIVRRDPSNRPMATLAPPREANEVKETSPSLGTLGRVGHERKRVSGEGG